MLNKLQNSLDKLKDADTSDGITDLLENPEKLEPIFNYIDQRVEQTATLIRQEVDQTTQQFCQEMKETMTEYHKQRLITLAINIAIAAFAWLGFLFNRLT